MNNMNSFTGMKVMITAGPTRVAIDPVRFISNHLQAKWATPLRKNFAPAARM